jgi:hypothetical protein
MKVGHQLFDTVELHNLAPIPSLHRRNGFSVGKGKALSAAARVRKTRTASERLSPIAPNVLDAFDFSFGSIRT